jgi:hypothetical protein
MAYPALEFEIGGIRDRRYRSVGIRMTIRTFLNGFILAVGIFVTG